MVVKSLMKRRLPVVMTVLFLATFVIAFGAGAFMYATGEQTIQTPKMAMVSHTEYAYSAPGQIIARLVDFQGNPVVVNNCTATILYPDKTSFVSAALMSASTISGDYYYNFTTPAGPEGTYEYQATCTYAAGTKTASVTNSFHLTPNFNNILANLSYIESQLDAVQGNLTEIDNYLVAMNSSLAGDIASLSAQLNSNVSTILSELSNVNSSLYTQIGAINTSLSTQITNLDAALAGNFSVIQSNFTQVLNALTNLTVSVNLTEVLDAIAALNVSTQQSFADLNAALAANFTYTNGLITGVNSSLVAEFGVVNSKLDVMNVTLNANNAYLVLINQTTTDTYAYVTGTLATNVGNILTDLGVINATVNRIETTTSQINTTTNTILQNQQDAVNMQVFSG